ncbi:MAG TPA: hypothetical protein PLJ21_12665 [Pseudobdellovibrionaceae bacterium]|nr:hypothetical protein [Pseudobdellovibrionaceae bacterium]
MLLNLLIKSAISSTLILTSLGVFAREHSGRGARIHQGVKNGSITRSERKEIGQQQRELREARKESREARKELHESRKALKDGATEEEKQAAKEARQNLREANQEQRKERQELNKEIYEAKHNDQNRPKKESPTSESVAPAPTNE